MNGSATSSTSVPARWAAPCAVVAGLAAFVGVGVAAMVGGVAVVTAVSFAVDPHWLTGWLRDVGVLGGRPVARYAPHTPPVTWLGGAAGLVGLLRWRTPEGRVLVAMTLMPASAQVYDHLLVWLACRGWRESVALSATAWAGYIAFLATAPHDLTADASAARLSIALGVYVPAAVMVLRRHLIR